MSTAELAPVESSAKQAPEQALQQAAKPVNEQKAAISLEQDPEALSEKISTVRSLVDELTGDGELSPAARDFVRKGGSVSSALEYLSDLGAQQAEISPQAELSEADQQLLAARGIYAEALSSKRGRKQKRIAESNYAQALIDKVKEETGIEPDQDESFDDSLKKLAKNEMAVVSRILLEERENLRTSLAEKGDPGIMSKIFGNKKLRGGLIAGVLGGSIAARTGLLPIEDEHTVHDIEHSLDAMTSYLFVAGSQNQLYQATKAAAQQRRHKKDRAEIERDTEALELSQHTVSNMGAEKEETPFTSDDAATFVSHVYRQHKEKLKTVAGETEQVSERYVELVSAVVIEEVESQRKELTQSRLKSIVFNTVAMASAATFTATTYRVAESVSMTRDLNETLRA